MENTDGESLLDACVTDYARLSRLAEPSEGWKNNLKGCMRPLLAVRQQLAEMRGALENWSNCVECGARRFDADVPLAPTSQPSRGKCDEWPYARCHGSHKVWQESQGDLISVGCIGCPDCAQPSLPAGSLAIAIEDAQRTVAGWPEDVRAAMGVQPERQEADIVLTDPEHIGVTVRPDGAIGISLRVEYTHKDDWPAISRECAQELWDVLSHTLSIHVDDISVDRFSVAMKAKLAKKREQGRAGWDDPTKCTIEALARMLIQHAIKGDPLDVGNFAMMLWNRGCEVELLREAKLWLDAPRVAPSTPQDDIVAGLRKIRHWMGPDLGDTGAIDRAIAALGEKGAI